MPASLYPNPPLVMVVLEIRHPRSEVSTPAHTFMKSVMSEYTPIERVETGVEFEIAQNGPPQSKQIMRRRLVSRDLHTSVSFQESAIVIETSHYEGWEWLRTLALAALTARNEFAPLDGLERIGLRYIDEIRVPAVDVDWAEWVSADLIAPRVRESPLMMRLTQQQSVAQYQSDEPGYTFTLRYGVSRGAVVGSTEHLRRLQEPPPDGEFFLIDTDAAWTDPSGSVPVFDPAHVLEICDALHAPIKMLFESLITKRLRDEVFLVEG